jgi:hypothetical protein
MESIKIAGKVTPVAKFNIISRGEITRKGVRKGVRFAGNDIFVVLNPTIVDHFIDVEDRPNGLEIIFKGVKAVVLLDGWQGQPAFSTVIKKYSGNAHVKNRYGIILP